VIRRSFFARVLAAIAAVFVVKPRTEPVFTDIVWDDPARRGACVHCGKSDHATRVGFLSCGACFNRSILDEHGRFRDEPFYGQSIRQSLRDSGMRADDYLFRSNETTDQEWLNYCQRERNRFYAQRLDQLHRG